MKQLSIALNILLLVLVAVLFYLHFNSEKKPQASKAAASSSPATADNSGDKIAYFEMDSLEANYQYFKDALAEIKSKEQAMNSELGSMERDYQKKMGEWQQKGPNMSQAEADAAQREKARMEQRYQQRRQVLEESVGKQSMEFKKDIKLKIETFLKDYNKDNRFAYILTSAPELIYYKDSTNDITGELLKGLNESYKKGTSDKK